MSEQQLTQPTSESPASHAAPRSPRAPAWVVVAAQALAVVAVFAGVGALCGLLWFHLWTPPTGVVSNGQWFTDETGLRGEFGGTGLFVAIGAAAGLVLGTLLSWVFDRSEIVTLLAVVAGSALAAWLMMRVGVHQSPPDPQVLARTAADGTKLPGSLALAVSGSPTSFGPANPVLRHTPLFCVPVAALAGLCATYALTSSRRARRGLGKRADR